MPSVLQPWVYDLPLMQQSVLISATRGPDGLFKDHIAKLICRAVRRSYLISAFDKRAIVDFWEEGGGSFTGPIRGSWPDVISEYLRHTDEIPHHFHLHIVHAAEILGYKHPDFIVRDLWHRAYSRMVNDMHLQPETEEQMDRRLGDVEHQWRAAEEVVAR